MFSFSVNKKKKEWKKLSGTYVITNFGVKILCSILFEEEGVLELGWDPKMDQENVFFFKIY